MTPEMQVAQNNELYQLPGYRPSDDERTWALITHLSTIVTGFLGPLIVMLAKGNESKWVKAHAVEALNFQLTLLIAYFAGFVLTFVVVGFCVVVGAVLGSLVLSILAGVKAYQGGAYRYPATIRFLKS